MKKFSEFKFKKVDLNKIQKDFTEMMSECNYTFSL